MKIQDWAKQEVDLAIKQEKSLAKKEKDSEYGIAIYEVALAGYLAVFEKEPDMTGTMVGFVSEMISRLFHNQPLTPIEDVPDQWEQVIGHDEYKSFQHKRMSSFFKKITKDENGNEKIVYNDIDRAHGYDINYNSTYHSGLIDDIINEMFPITMPYMPPTGSIRVYTEDFKFKNDYKGDLDTVGILYAKIPGHLDPIQIMRFFRDVEVKPPATEECRYPGWVEIKQDEYMKRKTEWFKRVQETNIKKEKK